VGLGFKLRVSCCKAGTLLLEPQLQFKVNDFLLELADDAEEFYSYSSQL
jgi:hypothetical protein